MKDKKQIEEWCESEGTLFFLHLLKIRLNSTFKQRAEVFFPYEPMKTQEAKAHLIGTESVLDELIEAISQKDLSQLEEPESEERIGDTPLPGSGTD